MKGKFQGQDEIIINATKEKIWNVLIDGSQLGKWMRIVKHTTSKTECLNAVRSCEVDFNGKMGQVITMGSHLNCIRLMTTKLS